MRLRKTFKTFKLLYTVVPQFMNLVQDFEEDGCVCVHVGKMAPAVSVIQCGVCKGKQNAVEHFSL